METAPHNQPFRILHASMRAFKHEIEAERARSVCSEANCNAMPQHTMTRLKLLCSVFFVSDETLKGSSGGLDGKEQCARLPRWEVSAEHACASTLPAMS